jgi:hypothetical protein
VPQEPLERAGKPGQIRRGLVGLDAEERRGGVVAQLGKVQVQASLVEQVVGEPGQVALQLAGNRREQRLQRMPAADTGASGRGELLKR